jgi:hypothetical protein
MWEQKKFSHLRGRGALCLSSYLTATSPKVNIFKNGLRSAEAFRNENGSGAHYLGGRARGGTLRLGRTALGGYVKFAVKGTEARTPVTRVRN